jgi:RNA polymerase sigma factor (sigma-70 family)
MSDDESRERSAVELLVIRCQLGERDAFDALIDRWHVPLWRFIRRMVGNDAVAEDILQDVWLRVVRGLGRLEEPARLAPWLFSIARRSVMDQLRRQYAEPTSAELEDENLPPAEIAESTWEETELLQEALAELPPREREAVALFYLRELRINEMADVLEVPVGTIKSRLHRARGMLRSRLKAKGVER